MKKLATENSVMYMSNSAGDAFLDVAGDAKAFNAMFTQQALRKVHDLMNPNGLKYRECRDSEAHPKTVPILFGLDVTGSMRDIPKHLCMDGLPRMMSTIIQRGCPDAAVCFLGVGDHEYDSGPIQVGQFESGDAELDTWLTRTWLEGGGGGNAGESYSLAWYVGARHTKTDACEKRATKGFLFTVGDEPILPIIPATTIRAFFGDGEPVQDSIKTEEILKEAQQCWNVFHIGLGERGETEWKRLLGQNYIQIDRNRYTEVPKIVAETIVSNMPANTVVTPTVTSSPTTEGSIML